MSRSEKAGIHAEQNSFVMKICISIDTYSLGKDTARVLFIGVMNPSPHLSSSGSESLHSKRMLTDSSHRHRYDVGSRVLLLALCIPSSSGRGLTAQGRANFRFQNKCVPRCSEVVKNLLGDNGQKIWRCIGWNTSNTVETVSGRECDGAVLVPLHRRTVI
jgi:hypothetical protein